jgi:rubrerythrin
MTENPVKIAIKMEIDGMAFYKKAADNTKDPLGKEMFLSFIEDEKKHLKALESIFKGADIDTLNALFNDSNPKKRIETVFSSAKEEPVLEGKKADPDEIDALVTAMKMEKEGYDYYMDIAENSDNDDIKRLFKMLAVEENQHYTILQNSHTYLVDSGNWFLWEEQGIIDGG